MDGAFESGGFDSEFESDAGFEMDTASLRVVRATIAGERLTLVQWRPGLAEGGPLGTLFRAREDDEVVIADLQLIRRATGENEVVVEFLAAGAARDRAQQRLIEWAAQTGYRRIWFADGPVDIAPSSAPLPTATIECPTCRASWTDSTPGFWLEVLSSGHFPLVCPLCANPLPQWRVSEEAIKHRAPAQNLA